MNSNTIPPGPPAVPNPTPPAIPAVPSFTATADGAIAPGGTFNFPSASGFSGSIAIPHTAFIPANTFGASWISNQSPLGASASTKRTLRGHAVSAAASLDVPIFYATLTTSAAVPLSAGTPFSFTMPSKYILGSTAYYLALNDPTNTLGWQLGFAGPGTLSGDTLSFPMAQSFNFAGNVRYAFQIYAVSSFAAAPATPAPPAAAYTLTGTDTQTFTYFYGFPSVEPPTTIVTNVTQNVTVLPTSGPSGAENDVHDAETDVLGQVASGGLQTVNSYSDAYTATSGSNVVLIGSTDTIPSGAGNAQSLVETTKYVTPQIVDKNPETNSSWTNSPAATYSESYGDGHSNDRTVASSGTYSEVGTVQSIDGSGYTDVDLSDSTGGAGSYGGPFSSGQYGNPLILDFSVPTGGKINVTYSQNKKPFKPLLSMPAWFPTNPTFYTEKDSLNTSASLPKGCPSGTGSVVTRSTTYLDTVIGYTETSTRQTYRTSNGVACVVFSDLIENYYNWNGDTPYLFYNSPNAKPISNVQTTETLALPGLLASSGAARRAIEPAVTAQVVAAAQARFNAKIEATRRRFVERVAKYLSIGKPLTGGVR